MSPGRPAAAIARPHRGLLLSRGGSEGLPVIYTGADATARLAAVELARFLSRLGGCRVRVITDEGDAARTGTAGRPALRLALRPDPGSPRASGGGDGFEWAVTPSGVECLASTGRGLLYAVYDLLAELGCRWFYPGGVGEWVPHTSELRLAHGLRTRVPALAGRSLILGHDLYLPDVEGWVEWAARNGLNNIFLHEFPPPILGGRSARYWRDALARAVPAARRRGLEVEFGGHGLAALLPRRLFRSHPEYFRHDGRRRTADHNFCPTNAEALAIVRHNSRAWLAARPGADVYHLWPDDIVGGGWCRCERCAELSASDQALIATNAVAEVLGEVYPGARLAYLVYHDTIEPPRRVEPHGNVAMLYAPRERCYAHALDDPGCPVNRDYHAEFLAGAGRFAGGGAQGGVVRVFEYHLDAILFKSMLPPLGRVLAADLQAYRSAGADTVGILMTSDREWVSVPPNLWLFGRLAWNPTADPDALLDDFAAHQSAAGVTAPAAAYRQLESAFRRLVELDGQDLALRLPGRDLVGSPPQDTLDFLTARPEGLPAARAKLDQLRSACAELRAVQDGLPAVPDGRRAEPDAGFGRDHDLSLGRPSTSWRVRKLWWPCWGARGKPARRWGAPFVGSWPGDGATCRGRSPTCSSPCATPPGRSNSSTWRTGCRPPGDGEPGAASGRDSPWRAWDCGWSGSGWRLSVAGARPPTIRGSRAVALDQLLLNQPGGDARRRQAQAFAPGQEVEASRPGSPHALHDAGRRCLGRQAPGPGPFRVDLAAAVALELRLHRAGQHREHAHAGAGELQAQGVGERHQGRLGGRVAAQTGHRLAGGQRSHRDHRPAADLHQARDGRPQEVESPQHVDREDLGQEVGVEPGDRGP